MKAHLLDRLAWFLLGAVLAAILSHIATVVYYWEACKIILGVV